MSTSPDPSSPLEREPSALEQAALAWVVRCDRGLDGEQQRQLATWLEADPRHGELFAEFGGTWTLMGQADSVQAASAAPGEILRFEESAADRAQTANRRRASRWLPLAAAAAIAVAAIGAWRLTGRDTAVATAVGATRELTLSDGSVVELNTDSAVTPVFTAAERRVRLTRGEAYFRVAKNPARPFVVEAAGVGVRALGTAFNVRMRAEGIEVLVTEGRVQVAPESVAPPAATTAPHASVEPAAPRASAELGAGERVLVPAKSPAATATAPAAVLGVAKVPADEMQRRLAWQERRLDFSDTPLGEMVAEFNRYNRHQLAVPDPALAALRFGGSFRPDDRVGFVRMLRENFRIHADQHGDATVLRAAP